MTALATQTPRQQPNTTYWLRGPFPFVEAQLTRATFLDQG